MTKNEEKRTNIITVEITDISTEQKTNEEYAAWIKETLNVDKVDIKKVKRF